MKVKFIYQCVDCQTKYEGEGVRYLCPACALKNKKGKPTKGVLKVVYNYQEIRSSAFENELFNQMAVQNFLPLLPLKSLDFWPLLRIGNTPCYHYRTSEFQCFLKDDSQNPTFSFKDRASALVSAWAKENGIPRLVAASTGNAGSSLAGICASQHQQAVIVVPSKAPVAKLIQVLMYGATLIPVNGTYDDAYALSIALSEKYGWYNRNTAYNPLTIEGKKTVAYELYQQLGFQVPDRIFIPTGDGVILAGVYRGFEDLYKLGIITTIPTLVAVQSSGSPNLVNNLGQSEFRSMPSRTIADSISVDVPGNFSMARDYLKKYNGEHILVSDEAIMAASGQLARTSGIFAEPAAAAAFAGLLAYHSYGRLEKTSRNVVLLTGSGLKDTASVLAGLKIPGAVEPDPEKLLSEIVI
jgi:threonine synthase